MFLSKKVVKGKSNAEMAHEDFANAYNSLISIDSQPGQFFLKGSSKHFSIVLF